MKSMLKAFSGLMLAIVTSMAAAAAPGQWTAAMGMDGQTMNYMVTDANGNNLMIQCGNEPATMSAVVNKHEYAPASVRSKYGKGDFVVIVDGKTLMPSDAGSNAGGENFRYVWDAIRAGKKVIIKGGKDTLELPVRGASQVLPPLQRTHCETW